MKCCGCGKTEPVPAGRTQPAGWLTSFNPLFGEPWEAAGCSHRCLGVARLRAVFARRANS